MKYLRKFETETDVKVSSNPNVVLIGDTGEILYNVEVSNGAYIQHIDGTIYTADEWTMFNFGNDLANGVAVIKDNVKFVISKTTASTYSEWASNTSVLYSSVVTTTLESTAKTDYAGLANTEAGITRDTGKAFYVCANYTFPNGQKGYLPALGEWMIVVEYLEEIEALLSQIGGTSLSSYSWSSTQYSSSQAWDTMLRAETPYRYSTKDKGRVARAFTTLEL